MTLPRALPDASKSPSGKFGSMCLPWKSLVMMGSSPSPTLWQPASRQFTATASGLLMSTAGAAAVAAGAASAAAVTAQEPSRRAPAFVSAAEAALGCAAAAGSPAAVEGCASDTLSCCTPFAAAPAPFLTDACSGESCARSNQCHGLQARA